VRSKAELIGEILNLHPYRLASTVPGVRFDADEHGVVAFVGGLLSKSTGNALNVDGGVAMGFYR